MTSLERFVYYPILLALLALVSWVVFLFCFTHNGIKVGQIVKSGPCIGLVDSVDGDIVHLKNMDCNGFTMHDVTLSSRDLKVWGVR